MKSLFFFFSVFVAYQMSAQSYGNIWHFGENRGLDFTNCEPTVISGANSGFEGCATICDEAGELLFYTNSVNVWNAENELMPGSSPAAFIGSQSQSLIIPKPLSETHYYVISTPLQAADDQVLEYMEVDMTMNDGLGDIISDGNEMTDLIMTEQVAATYHSNGTNIWVMTHEYGTNAFLAFLVTDEGVNLNPVVSNVGPSHSPCFSNLNARGEIKFSPDGSKVAFNGNGIGPDDMTDLLCLLEFDNTSGEVFNPINLPYSRGEFGLSFSPDNTKLYGATWKAFSFDATSLNYLYQFDISSGDSATIAASKYIVDTRPVGQSFGSVKIGPNGKIYIRATASQYLHVINEPNLAGELCSYDPQGVFLGPSQFQYGLNNYIEYQTYCSTLSTDNIEASRERRLVRILDLMGRESEDLPNRMLIHVYDDHSREKVFRVEP